MSRIFALRGRLASVVILGGFAMAIIAGCQQPNSTTPDEKSADRDLGAQRDEDTPKKEPKRVQFAEDRGKNELKAVPFDGKRAMNYLRELCAIGPRISGSEGMKKQQELLVKHFEKQGAKVSLQKFDGKQPSQKKAVPMANMIIVWNPDAKRRIIFCGHYDTRPIADQEPRERDWHKPFLSANDGTSTVAFLMELAHHMKDVSTNVGVDFVIFDGEEFMYDRDNDLFFLGSEHFAAEYKKNKPEHKYVAGVLLDLFAAKDATFKVEPNSFFLAGEVLESIWIEAAAQGVKSFLNEKGTEVQDDHLALNHVGIPTVDLIDFSYRHWHKLTDLPDQCSGDKMAEVAKVLTAWMQRVK